MTASALSLAWLRASVFEDLLGTRTASEVQTRSPALQTTHNRSFEAWQWSLGAWSTHQNNLRASRHASLLRTPTLPAKSPPQPRLLAMDSDHLETAKVSRSLVAGNRTSLAKHVSSSNIANSNALLVSIPWLRAVNSAGCTVQPPLCVHVRPCAQVESRLVYGTVSSRPFRSLTQAFCKLMFGSHRHRPSIRRTKMGLMALAHFGSHVGACCPRKHEQPR